MRLTERAEVNEKARKCGWTRWICITPVVPALVKMRRWACKREGGPATKGRESMVFSVLEPQRDRTGPVLTKPTATRRAWIPGLVLLGLIVLLGGGLGYLVGNERQANTQTDQAHATWQTTRHHIAIAVSDLTLVGRDLRADNQTIQVVGPALAQDTAQVKAVQAALASAQASVLRQGTTIAGLQACLGGVEQALNALSVGDLDQAVSHLSAVATPCQQVAAGG